MLGTSLWRAFGATLLVALAAGGAGAGTARAAVELANPLRVVVLGDSYSAGNGAGDYYGDPAAYRSHRSWANLYADWLAEQPNLPLQYVSYAHSGAETSDMELGISVSPTLAGRLATACRL